MLSRFALSNTILSLLLAAAVVVLLFFDVVFLKASIQPGNIYSVLGKPAAHKTITFPPSINFQQNSEKGTMDLAAPAIQHEPAIGFMSRVVKHGESPYWNPYSAAGMEGPETLVDMKFSPLVVISAAFFNGSSASYNFLLLGLFVLSGFCLIKALRCYFNVSWAGATLGFVFFLLNGFALANLGSQMGRPYFYAPILVLALLRFVDNPTYYRWVLLLFVDVVLLTLTFLPTLALTVLTAHLMVFSFMLQRYGLWKERVKITGAVVGAGVLAISIAAPLWFPIVESLLRSDLVADYTSRRLYVFHVADNLLSFFTPMHYWESYTQGLMSFEASDTIDYVSRALLPHIGLTVIFILGLGRRALLQKGANKFLYVLVFIFFCVLFNFFGLAQLFSYPPLNIFSIQYLGLPIVLAISYLLPQCWDALAMGMGKASIKGGFIALLLVGLAFFSLFYRLGFPDEVPFSQYIFIFISLWLLLFLLLLSLWLVPLVYKSTHNKLSVSFAVFVFLLVISELYFYMNHTRPERFEVISKPPELVQKIKGYVGEGRVFNAGINNTLFPEFGAMYGIRQSGTNNSTLVPWYQAIFVRNFGTSVPRYLDVGRLMQKSFGDKNKPKPSKKAFNLIGANVLVISRFTVGYSELAKEYGYPLLYEDSSTRIYQNPDAMPRYYTVNNIVNTPMPIESSYTDLALAVHSTDEALLLEAQQKAVPIIDMTDAVFSGAKTTNTIEVLAESNGEIKLAVVMNQPGILVALEAWHPNWRALVDGQPATIGLVNGAFRGVALGVGKHEVILDYRPRSLTVGLICSVIALLLVLLGLVVRFRVGALKKGVTH